MNAVPVVVIVIVVALISACSNRQLTIQHANIDGDVLVFSVLPGNYHQHKHHENDRQRYAHVQSADVRVCIYVCMYIYMQVCMQRIINNSIQQNAQHTKAPLATVRCRIGAHRLLGISFPLISSTFCMMCEICMYRQHISLYILVFKRNCIRHHHHCAIGWLASWQCQLGNYPVSLPCGTFHHHRHYRQRR